MKVAIVAQRYGADINGGAELHARYVAEHLARHAEVEVLKILYWLRITTKRFVVKTQFGNLKFDVPIEQVSGFRGDGTGVTVSFVDGRTSKVQSGLLYKERVLVALERVTGRQRQR